MVPKETIAKANFVAASNILDILNKFGLKLEIASNGLFGTCPCHGSNRYNSFAYYYNDGNPRWQCFTNKCHQIFCDSAIGFVRGLLSRKNGFCKTGDTIFGFAESIDWILKEYGETPLTLVNTDSKCNAEIDSKIVGDFQITREEVRNRLILPSDYFIRRGFSPEVLDKYDVGYSKKHVKKTCWRAIVPVYDLLGKYCIGATARSIFDKCETCGCHHDKKWNCPKDSYKGMYSKWKNVGFRKRYSLYNYWFLPQTTKDLIIVESPGNVWKLVNIGVTNVVALYGSDRITEYQKKLLSQKGVENIYFAFDNDKAGEKAFQLNGTYLWKDFNIHKLNVTEVNDIAEMSDENLKKMIIDIDNKVCF